MQTKTTTRCQCAFPCYSLPWGIDDTHRARQEGLPRLPLSWICFPVCLLPSACCPDSDVLRSLLGKRRLLVHSLSCLRETQPVAICMIRGHCLPRRLSEERRGREAAGVRRRCFATVVSFRPRFWTRRCLPVRQLPLCRLECETTLARCSAPCAAEHEMETRFRRGRTPSFEESVCEQGLFRLSRPASCEDRCVS